MTFKDIRQRSQRRVAKILLKIISASHLAIVSLKSHDEETEIFANITEVERITALDFRVQTSLIKKSKHEWQYPLFSHLVRCFSSSTPRILEIGTYDGKFASFVAESLECPIVTVDLGDNDAKFMSTYSRNTVPLRDQFIQQRNARLNHPLIEFLQLDSKFLLRGFEKREFDLVWVDGDHLDPQVSLDIFSALHLVKPGGFIAVDDVCPVASFGKYVSTDSYKTLDHLNDFFTRKGLILKKISPLNLIQKRRKYIFIGQVME